MTKTKKSKKDSVQQALKKKFAEEINRLLAKHAVKIRGLRKANVKNLIAQSSELNRAYNLVKDRKFSDNFFYSFTREVLGFTRSYTKALLAIRDLWVGKAIEDIATYFDTVAMLNIAKMSPLDASDARDAYMDYIRDHIAKVKGCYVSGKVVLWPTFRYSEWFKKFAADLKATAEAAKPKYQWLTLTDSRHPGSSLQIKTQQKGKKLSKKQMVAMALDIITANA